MNTTDYYVIWYYNIDNISIDYTINQDHIGLIVVTIRMGPLFKLVVNFLMVDTHVKIRCSSGNIGEYFAK